MAFITDEGAMKSGKSSYWLEFQSRSIGSSLGQLPDWLLNSFGRA